MPAGMMGGLLEMTDDGRVRAKYHAVRKVVST
jgi:hypothetical protein